MTLPVQATTVLWRVIPMGFLFLVRVSVTATRWHLGSGSKEATWHYIMMEARMHVPYALGLSVDPACLCI